MITDDFCEELITKENLSSEQLAELGIKNLNALTETLKNEKELNFYQLVFVATIINDIVVIPSKYYIPCDSIARIIKKIIETLDKKNNLDQRAYISLSKVSKELITYHKILDSTLNDLNMLKIEYYHLIY